MLPKWRKWWKMWCLWTHLSAGCAHYLEEAFRMKIDAPLPTNVKDIHAALSAQSPLAKRTCSPFGGLFMNKNRKLRALIKTCSVGRERCCRLRQLPRIMSEMQPQPESSHRLAFKFYWTDTSDPYKLAVSKPGFCRLLIRSTLRHTG